MPGARAVVTRQVPDHPFAPKASKRHGPISPTERKLVVQFCKDQPREVTEKQVTALSQVLRRSKEVVRGLVEAAREEFVASADFYVQSHKLSVERALEVTDKFGEHDPKALDVAARASAWALENLSAEGQRVVDAKSASKGDGGTKIMINIPFGGMNTAPTVDVVEIPPSEGGESIPLKQE